MPKNISGIQLRVCGILNLKIQNIIINKKLFNLCTKNNKKEPDSKALKSKKQLRYVQYNYSFWTQYNFGFL